MCSIFGSFSKDKIVELANLNRYRGQHSYSFTYWDPETKYITYMQRALGELNVDDIKIPEGQYCIAHMQAPTTENKHTATIHPANINLHYLWHNGIVKERCIKEMEKNAIFVADGMIDYLSWDTYLILHQLVYNDSLENIDGTFSCLYCVNGHGLQLFRNEISPMFVDEHSNISSTKFIGSKPLEPNIIWNFVPGQPIIDKLGSFKTVENPYFFMDERK